MDYNVIEYKKLNERVYEYKHNSGLRAFVVPKKGYQKKYATFAVNYGSIDSEFFVPETGAKTRVPDGIAHFLEHKLFEQKDGSVMDKYSALGANPNAYTGFNQTVYLFSCTDTFNENFKLLLDFVQNPYLTEESVEKEKGIIAQEIKMYEDNPEWRVFFNLLRALYHNNSVKIDIAGTVESISQINKDILYMCYRAFYSPSNMILVVVGDVEPEDVFNMVEEGIYFENKYDKIERVVENESDTPAEKIVEQRLQVSTHLFQMGIKDISFCGKGLEAIKREVAMKIILEIIMGKSSLLYERLYEAGLVNSTFGFDYNIEPTYAFSMWGGQTTDPEKVRMLMIEEINKMVLGSLSAIDCERIRKAHKGRFIKQLNSVERISQNFISVFFKDVSMFDYNEIYDTIDYEYINGVFKQHFSNEIAFSVVSPLPE